MKTLKPKQFDKEDQSPLIISHRLGILLDQIISLMSFNRLLIMSNGNLKNQADNNRKQRAVIDTSLLIILFRKSNNNNL